ncbi:recombinase family protein [Clostridium botulinum]|uniref:recombinase family protein n=1 Tax=Clostridium botulinum TaxID=1491 RepID=UPI0007734091|nr:recombinase family protein [Clostridium botulinum]MBN3403391.1 resolvase [Clostridium botulinum]NEZ84461.1 recombinase family protein [Clostridium botulinum]NFA05769.1 recombinase family protein [Clostridium botulinum]NFA25185.1 recombinase family protein [Clostridium botulinum]NFB80199.1 recombinase family protein [Clostridium botulinum]
MLYGYCRSANGNKESLEKQIEWLKDKGVKIENIYEDVASGLNTNRVQFNKLLENIKKGDTIFSKDIEKITRDVKELEKIIEFAKTKRVKFVLGEHVINGINGVDKGVEGISAVFSTLKEYEQSISSDIDNIEN